MRLNRFLTLLFVLALSIQAEAQQQKVYQVGFLTIGSLDTPEIKGLRDGLKESGYVDGKNLVLDIPAKKTYDELRPIANAFVQRKFDLILTASGTLALMAKKLTSEIPIVFVGGIGDPMASGLVKSMAHPDANVTGIAARTDVELHGKRLQTFKEVMPKLRQVAVFYNARGESPGHAKSLALVQKVAPSLRLRLAEKPIKSNADLESALSSVSRDNTDGIFVICSSLFAQTFKTIIAAATQKRLGSIGCKTEDVTEKGALLSYATDGYRIGRRGAWYVDRVLKGAKPQDLPIESPTYFELVINLKTAKQIGVTIPPEVLARADRVIK